MADNKSKHKTNNYFQTRALCLLVSFCVCLNIYHEATKKKQFKSNIFSDNTISISDEEVNVICSDLEKILNIDITEEEKDEYLVLNSIKENDEFGDYKKWFCGQIINMIKDNPYLNKEEVYKLLLNVKITYNDKAKYISPNCQGRYNIFLNNVEIFSGYPSLEVLFHEIIHCIYNTQRLPRFFKEGMTELLTNEYSNIDDCPFKETNTYIFEVSVVKMLCELTTPDTVLKAFTLGNMEYIIDEITAVIGNKEEVELAIKTMGDALDSFKKQKNYDLKEFNTNCISVFQKCMDSKYGYDESSYISYYYNEMLFCNCLFFKTAMVNYNRDISLCGIDYKAYFSSDLKNKIRLGEFDLKKEENDMQKMLNKIK